MPDAVERWLRMYEAERNEGEEFIDYAARVGTGRFEEEIRELSIPAEFNLENMLQFIDWSRRDPYKVVRGEGECASIGSAPTGDRGRAGSAPGGAPPQGLGADDRAAASRSTRARSTPSSRDSSADAIAWALETFHPRLRFAARSRRPVR